MTDINEIRQQVFLEIENASDIKQLEDTRIKYLGRKGVLSEILTRIGELPPEQKPVLGRVVNELKKQIEDKLKIKILNLSANPKKIYCDITMPVLTFGGSIHPLSRVMDEICDVFIRMGFSVAEGPEVETEKYNFTILNIPKDHPSRDAFDTFYLENNLLLRSQTSTVQGRVMEKKKPPLKIISQGRVYRPDAVDATHSFMFHQIEGFYVDKNVRFTDLKGTIEIFLKTFFGKDTKARFIPHYFPFTEPSAEVEMSCIFCSGKGCNVCGGSGWKEILGCGMIHPEVFKNVGYRKERFTGFAFGMGVERIAMFKYLIPDIRLFFENDIRFIRQFK
jgi:phenylalanyl-tRNA synthetase alpha chain